MALATALVQEIAGGTAGPVAMAELPDELPRIRPVQLRSRQLQRLLGASVAAADVEQRLRALGMGVRPEKAGWSVQPPSWRFDIEIEPDLIEEVVRIGGLESIEERAPEMAIVPRMPASGQVDERVVMRTLAARGYQEVITFGFVDPALQRQLFGAQPGNEHSALELANPIAADLAAMRSSLLPGLIAVARENLRRQQQRVRVFEIANRFVGDKLREQKMLAGHNATLLGVTYEDAAPSTKGFVHDYHVDYPVVRDVSGTFVRSFGTDAVPETFVINRQGKVQAVRREPVTAQWFRQTLPKILAGQA